MTTLVEAGRNAERAEGRAHTRLVIGNSVSMRVFVIALLVILSLLWLLPFLWAIATSLKSEISAAADTNWIASDGITFDAYTSVFAAGNVGLWMWNTFLISAIATVLTVLVSAMAGFAIARTNFRGRKALLAVTIGSIMVPPQILIVPLFGEMLALGLVDTFAGVILPQLVAPVMVFILARFISAIPQEILDAAAIDGASAWRTFWHVVLPLSRSVLIAVAIFVFIGVWNNFLWPFIVTNDPALMTLPVGLSTVKSAYGIQYAQSMASAMIAAVPLLVIFMIFQRRIVQSVATTGLNG